MTRRYEKSADGGRATRNAMSSRETLDFLKHHILTYSMWGKTSRDGHLVWFDTGEPCDEEGTKRHFAKVVDQIRKLEALAASDAAADEEEPPKETP